MKKFLIVLLTVLCIFCFVACDSGNDTNDSNPPSSEQTDNGNNNSSNNDNSNNNNSNNNNDSNNNTVSVAYMNNMSIYHQDDGCFRFLFSLQDQNENDIKIGATVKIRIVNDLGVEVYRKTSTVTEHDYSQWENRYYGTSWIAAAIYIKDTDITAGQVDEGTFYYQVTASDGSTFDEFSLDIDSLPIKESSFAFNEKWVVNGEWELTILNAELHTNCDSNAGLAQYVLITYTYKNLGNGNSAGLAFTEYDFNVYDSNGNLVSSSNCWEHVKVAEYIDKGASYTASIVYGFENSTNTIKIVAEKYDSNYNTIKATFNGTITTCEHKIVTDKGYNATCEAEGLTDGSHCSKCGTVITKQTTIPKKEHSWTTATCTTARKCSGCGYSDGTKADHNYSNGQCTACGKSDSSYTYSVGQKWIVDGQWEFTITSVTRHRLCNSYSNSKYGYTDEDVILVEYSYKNIGYDGELYITAAVHFNVYDADGNVLSRYACTHNGYPQDCIVGTSCSGASEAYISEIKGASAKIHITLYTDDSRKMTATYVVPIT